MTVLNIIQAPSTKRAVWYDPNRDELILKIADVVGLVELQNPDNIEESTTIPMYMTSDRYGIFSLPQLDANFLEFIDPGDHIDIGNYTDKIEEIKNLYKTLKANSPEIIEVETNGKVSKIKRIIKNVKTEGPKNEN